MIVDGQGGPSPCQWRRGQLVPFVGAADVIPFKFKLQPNVYVLTKYFPLSFSLSILFDVAMQLESVKDEISNPSATLAQACRETLWAICSRYHGVLSRTNSPTIFSLNPEILLLLERITSY